MSLTPPPNHASGQQESWLPRYLRCGGPIDRAPRRRCRIGAVTEHDEDRFQQVHGEEFAYTDVDGPMMSPDENIAVELTAEVHPTRGRPGRAATDR